MILKIFRSVWFLSAVLVLMVLLYVYASLPQSVVIQQDGVKQAMLSRDAFFYVALGFVTLINSMVYLIRKVFLRQEAFRTWFHGLIIAMNGFFIVCLFLINSFNSGENFDFSRIGFVVYASIGLIIAWALAWPAYLLLGRTTIKSVV
jgi:hypothetical protein